MRAEEVVVSYKKGRKRNSAIEAVEAASRSYVIFKGSIEAFNDLFKRSELL